MAGVELRHGFKACSMEMYIVHYKHGGATVVTVIVISKLVLIAQSF